MGTVSRGAARGSAEPKMEEEASDISEDEMREEPLVSESSRTAGHVLGRVDNDAQSPASAMKAQGSETPFYPPKMVPKGTEIWPLALSRTAADMSVKDVVYDAVVKAMVSDAPKDDEFYRRLGKTVADVVKGEHREAHANECDHRLSAAMRELVEWAVAK
ncbi:unnamed protein product [Caenorhabditis bovis]|uniref:Uncharacterized protein n=1 Tax=Caenorhabditis bovis TaxID=2654633 RepID=A0A8S1ELV3_9PELO|nr:unnamed protein product [Caenorhabditis bovis]